MNFRSIRRFPLFLNDGTKKWYFPFIGDDGRICWRWPYRQPIVEEVPAGWWDENSLVDIDFVNDRAWTAADGEVAISSLIGNDPVVDNGWGTSGYDPSGLNAEGYSSGDVAAFIGTLRDLLLAGSTAVIQWKRIGLGAWSFILMDDSGDASVGHDIDADILGYAWGGGSTYNIDEVVGFTADAANKLAATLTPSRAELAGNGALISAESLTALDWPTSGVDELICGFISSGVHRIQSITVYDPLPDTTGLPALSALE